MAKAVLVASPIVLLPSAVAAEDFGVAPSKLSQQAVA